MPSQPSRCPFCGDRYQAEILEVWGREFQLSTCCEAAHHAVVDEMPADGLARGADIEVWLRQRLHDAGVACRQIFSHGGATAIDYGLRTVSVDFRTASQFVDEHHRHHSPPPGWRWGHGLRNGRDLVAVAIVGRPVARALPADRVVEVTRMCSASALPRQLTWNACSMLYGAAAREAARRGFRKIITYTLDTEGGSSLRAAGWTREARTAGGSWNTPSRPRLDRAPTGPKYRWARLVGPPSRGDQLALF